MPCTLLGEGDDRPHNSDKRRFFGEEGSLGAQARGVQAP